jgi:ABC-2 type transport system permease protein
VLRYLRLFAVQLRASALLALQYRYDFLTDGAISLLSAGTALIPLFVVFENRLSIAGWSRSEALIVVGWFTLMEAIIEGAIGPSLSTVVEHIRMGTLDFVLLKPADAQFLVSTSRFQPWKATNVLTAGAIFIYAFHDLGRTPAALHIGAAALLLISAISILYSLWILTVCAAFLVVKVDNLSYLFTSIFDAARWPAPVFRGVVRFLFTFVIPLALMTTFPAEAMLGRLEPERLLGALGGALAFGAAARLIWMQALSKYTSASS